MSKIIDDTISRPLHYQRVFSQRTCFVSFLDLRMTWWADWQKDLVTNNTCTYPSNPHRMSEGL